MDSSLHFSSANIPFVYDGRDSMVLPQPYSPGPDVVIIGRGKKVQQHPANVRFRNLIQAQLGAYSSAATKGLKSNILWRVLHEVRSYSPSRLGFVKRDNQTGRWYAIDDASAKINISQAFRDGLSHYRSSKKRKQLKRKISLDSESTRNTISSSSNNNNNAEARQVESSIVTALNRFESSQEMPSNKGKRVSLNEAVADVPDPTDHTIGRLNHPTMDRLQSFLCNQATIPLPATSNQLNVLLKDRHEETLESWDTFSKLFDKFGDFNDKVLSEDPFEPHPIIKPRPNYVWDDSQSKFPHFEMTEMVERTNPADNLSVNSNIFDEAMLPSLDTLEVAGMGALDMTSFSSLSDIGDQDQQDLQQDLCDFSRRSVTRCRV